MTLPDLKSRVDGWVVGDDLTIRRTIDAATSGFIAGETVTKAWLTVKASVAEADPGLLQKEITTSDVAGTGQIEDDGTGGSDPVLRFDLAPADTIAIGTSRREFDVQILTSEGKVRTVERGQIWGKSQVTEASS